MKRTLLALAATAMIVGCGSSVKLDDVPVEDKVGTAVPKPGADAGGNSVAKGNVAAVDLGKSAQPLASPAGPRLVYFEYDSFVVKPEFQTVIEANARYLRAEKTRKVAIEGHTDERGGREYNLALGQKRAEAVRRALAIQGVADAQMEAVSFGKEKPAIEGQDENAMGKNRRAEIQYR